MKVEWNEIRSERKQKTQKDGRADGKCKGMKERRIKIEKKERMKAKISSKGKKG